jgi:hypothetical protein
MLTAAHHHKNNCVKIWLVIFTKGTVDKNVPVGHLLLPGRLATARVNTVPAADLTLAIAASICLSVNRDAPLGDFKITTPSCVTPATA